MSTLPPGPISPVGSDEIQEIKQLASESRKRAQQAWLVYVGWAVLAGTLLAVVTVVVWSQFRFLSNKLESASEKVAKIGRELAEEEAHSNAINQQLREQQARLAQVQQTEVARISQRLEHLQNTKADKGAVDEALAVRIPGQGGRDSGIDPISIPK